jgi:membrane protein implicated in regulation of membrane protease activity
VAYWHWLVLGMVLAGIEIFVPSFTILWFGVGALLVGATLYFVDLSTAWQLMLWAISSGLFTWGWFHFFRNRAPNRTMAGLSREAMLGETAQVIIAPHGDKRGTVRFATPKLGAEEWEFICEQPVAVGDRVAVQDVSGNTLIVTRR